MSQSMENHPIHQLPIELEPYNPEWPHLFAQEAERLRHVFGDSLVEIHHIGSTSVPGLVAKPLIDIIPVVHNLDALAEMNPSMEQEGYIPMGELGIPGRRFFCKGLGCRTYNVHVYQKGDPHIARHLKFRDILRERPDLAKDYGELKQRLAEEFREDRKAYTDAKTDFIRKVEQM